MSRLSTFQASTYIDPKQRTLNDGKKFVVIKASMNYGLSEELKAAAVFTDIIPEQRPSVLDCLIKDPNLLAGFATGEGCFYIKI